MSDTSVGKIDLDLEINRDGYSKQLNDISGTASNVLGGAFMRLGGIIAAAFAVEKLKDFTAGAIELASNLNEVQNVVDVTFGNMSNQIDAFSKNALQQFGISELSAKKFSSTMGAMLKSSGLTGQQVVDMSEGITGLSADMASFYNLNQQDAFDKIRAGLAGMVEPLRQLGINMSEQNLQQFAYSQGIKTNIKDMNQASQELLRYNYLMSVTKDAQGDFARTSNSWANQVRLMGEQWKIFETTMGQGFINMLTPVLKGLNELILKLQVAAQYFRAFTVAIFGSQQVTSSTSSAVSSAAASTDKLGNSVKNTAAAIKGSLASFDQLNVVGQNAAGALGDAAGGLGDLGDMPVAGGKANLGINIDPATFEPVKQAIDYIKTTAAEISNFFKKEFGPVVSQVFANLNPVLNGWRDSLSNTFSAISRLGEPLKEWFINDLVPFWQKEIFLIGDTTKGILDTGLKVFNGLRDVAMPVLGWFVKFGLPLMTSFADDTTSAFWSMFQTTKHIFDTLWSDAIVPGLNLVVKIVTDTLNIIKDTWNKYHLEVLSGITVGFNNIKKLFDDLWYIFLKPVVDEMLSTMSWLWQKHLKGVVDEVANFVGVLVVDVLEIFNKFIVPIVDFLVKMLGPTFKNTIKSIIDVVGTVIGVLADVVKGLIKILEGLLDFITGILTLNWTKAWKGLGEVVSGVFISVLGVVKGAVNSIIDMVNSAIRSINSIHVDIPSWVPGVGGKDLGVNIPSIPKLANGGMVSSPTLAMIGDNRNAASDPEVVTPLSKLQNMLGASNQGIIEALMMILQAIENQPTSIEMDGEKLTRIIRNRLTAENNRIGKRVVQVGGVYV